MLNSAKTLGKAGVARFLFIGCANGVRF